MWDSYLKRLTLKNRSDPEPYRNWALLLGNYYDTSILQHLQLHYLEHCTHMLHDVMLCDMYCVQYILIIHLHSSLTAFVILYSTEWALCITIIFVLYSEVTVLNLIIMSQCWRLIILSQCCDILIILGDCCTFYWLALVKGLVRITYNISRKLLGVILEYLIVSDFAVITNWDK